MGAGPRACHHRGGPGAQGWVCWLVTQGLAPVGPEKVRALRGLRLGRVWDRLPARSRLSLAYGRGQGWWGGQDHPGGSLGRWAARAPKANSTAGDRIPPALPGWLLRTGCSQQAPQVLKHPHTRAKTFPGIWEDLATCHGRSWSAERCPAGLSVPNTGSPHATVG